MKKYLPIIIIAVVILLGGIYLLANSGLGGAPEHNGHAENQPVEQSHRSYDIEVTQKPQADQITLNEPTTIKYKIKNDRGEIVKDFAIAHEKLMHFIVVRKDLTQFDHLHPTYDESTGEFSVDSVFTVEGPYRFFADFTPVDDNPQKLPVTLHSDLNVGDISNFQPHTLTADTMTEKVIPPDYQVAYSFANELESQSPTTYTLTVTKNNETVNLEEYLGALGHSVVLQEGTLDYIHTHAGDQSEMSNQNGHEGHAMNTTSQNSNKIDFSTTFPEPGIYKIFTQFQHEGNVLTTDYTVMVK